MLAIPLVSSDLKVLLLFLWTLSSSLLDIPDGLSFVSCIASPYVRILHDVDNV